jgi:catechol 2,3-dioxygenase-like lactoylglutathione lyase family enzyme
MHMNYATLGTNDMAAAIRFYGALFAGAGLMRLTPSDRMTYWVGEGFAFAIAIPFDEQPATRGNGTMIGFGVEAADEVDRLHQLALDLGGTSDGAPGPRGPRYSAYIRDLDGNKLCLADMG